MATTTQLTDEAVLAELGAKLAHHRLARGLTQAALARQAGVSKRTLERLEAGGSTQLSNLIRVLRVLGLQDALLGLVPDSGPSPMDLLKLKGKQRRRASSQQATGQTEEWNWGEGS